MRGGKRILAVIPARGGSKGIPKKNVLPVAGKPLIAYTTELLAHMPWIDHAAVSTDSEEVAAEAAKAATTTIIWRPEALSGDRVGDMPVLRHALARAEAESKVSCDVVVMLQPTSPLRRVREVEGCVDLLLSGDWDSVWTVSETDLSYHPSKQVGISSSGALEFFVDGGQAIIARQQLKPAYHRNGVAYAFRSDFVRASDSVFSQHRSTALITQGTHISIDTMQDVRAVEMTLRERSTS